MKKQQVFLSVSMFALLGLIAVGGLSQPVHAEGESPLLEKDKEFVDPFFPKEEPAGPKHILDEDIPVITIPTPVGLGTIEADEKKQLHPDHKSPLELGDLPVITPGEVSGPGTIEVNDK